MKPVKEKGMERISQSLRHLAEEKEHLSDAMPLSVNSAHQEELELLTPTSTHITGQRERISQREYELTGEKNGHLINSTTK